MPNFYWSGELSASLNFDEKVVWMKKTFARCWMRMEEVSAHDAISEGGMHTSCDDLFYIDWSNWATSAEDVTYVKSKIVHCCVADQNQNMRGAKAYFWRDRFLRTTLLRRRKEPGEYGCDREGESCSLGGDAWRSDLIVAWMPLRFVDASMMHSTLDGAPGLFVNLFAGKARSAISFGSANQAQPPSSLLSINGFRRKPDARTSEPGSTANFQRATFSKTVYNFIPHLIHVTINGRFLRKEMITKFLIWISQDQCFSCRDIHTVYVLCGDNFCSVLSAG